MYLVATLRSCRLASLNPYAVLRACRLLSTLTYSLPAIGHARGKALDMVYRAVLEARRILFSSACCVPGSGEQEAGILTLVRKQLVARTLSTRSQENNYCAGARVKRQQRCHCCRLHPAGCVVGACCCGKTVMQGGHCNHHAKPPAVLVFYATRSVDSHANIRGTQPANSTFPPWSPRLTT